VLGVSERSGDAFELADAPLAADARGARQQPLLSVETRMLWSCSPVNVLLVNWLPSSVLR